MTKGIGVLVSERITAGLIENDRLAGKISSFPDDAEVDDALVGLPAELIARQVAEQVLHLGSLEGVAYLGVGFPGIIRRGVIEDSPNLPQLKGSQIGQLLKDALQPYLGELPIVCFNDADIFAAGLAATRNHLDRLIRVWTLGNGIGYGRYPYHEGAWEAGHSVVTLDPREHFCGCGGSGHLEGIMGQRAMRLRFMDMEPEEIFQQALGGDHRCVEFVKLWHRALAAGTATSIHLDGPGKFFVTGINARFVNMTLLSEYLNEMVKLSPLQGYSLEVVTGGEEVAVIGAAVNASRWRSRS
jgi:predicted NBD/HSP70 family sugar kinase